HDWVTLASMTSRKSLAAWSTIFETLLRPPATTRMSMRPNALTAPSTMSAQFASELGRLAMVPTRAPSFSHSAATFLSSAALPAASTTLAPAAASTFAASAPNAPDAPVTIAVLPRMSNSDRGFFRMSSDMMNSFFGHGRTRPGHPTSSTRNSPDVDARHKAGHDGFASLHRRDRHQDGADLVAAIDDLA